MKKITGIKKVCGFTKCLHPYCGLYLQVVIEAATGKLYSVLHTQNSYTAWDKGFYAVNDYYLPTTMREIKKDAIEALKFAAWLEKQD